MVLVSGMLLIYGLYHPENVTAYKGVHTCSLGVHNTLRNPLTIKMSHFIHVDKILHQHWATGTNSLYCLFVVNGMTMASRENFWSL